MRESPASEPRSAAELAEQQLRSALPVVALISGLAAAAGAAAQLTLVGVDAWQGWSLPAHLCLAAIGLWWMRHPPKRASRAAFFVAAYFSTSVGSFAWETGDPVHFVNLGLVSLLSFYFIADARYLIAAQLFALGWIAAIAPGIAPHPNLAPFLTVCVVLWGGGLSFRLGRVRVLREVAALQNTLRSQREELAEASRALGEESEKRRQVQEKAMAAQKLESLGVMAGGIAHDFNNLLTGILGGAEIALDPAAEPRVVERALRMVRESSLSARALCRRMLDFAGSNSSPTRPVDVNRVARDAIRLAGSGLPAGVVLSPQLASALPPVEGDATQIQQMIVNLISNAVEAMAGGGRGEILVTTQLAGERIVLAVSDQGPGISEEIRDRIFDPFFTTKFTGRGLGLSTVMGIVRSHGGEIRVRSGVGRGTRFEIELPRSAHPIAAPEPKGAEEASRPGDGCILLVDDEVLVRETGSMLIRSLGFDVRAVSNGEDAIVELKSSPRAFRAAVVDATMPGIDGAETIRALRRLAPDLPILLSSGLPIREAAPTGDLDGPPIQFLPKPYRRAELAACIERAVAPAAVG